MKSFKTLFFISLIFLPVEVHSKVIRIVTTTEDLADIARSIGKDKVKVKSLSKGYWDIHFVEPRPSMIVALRRTDLLIRVGMDLDLWVQPLIDSARNPKIFFGEKGYVDASQGIIPLEVPTGKVDGSMGDIHIYGNPHFWLDPQNGKIIAKNILNALTKMSPQDRSFFENNFKEFTSLLDKKISEWKSMVKPYKGTPIVGYHDQWPYFARAFGFRIVGYIEPKPGIPPNPSHILKLINKMKKEGVKVILVAPYFSLKVPQYIAKQTGAKAVVVPTSVGGTKDATSYISLFDVILTRIMSALR